MDQNDYYLPIQNPPLVVPSPDPWTRVATTGVGKFEGGEREIERESSLRKANHIIISLYSCRYEGKLY